MSIVEGYLTTPDGVRLFYQKIGVGSPTVIVPNAVYLFHDFKSLASDQTIIFYDLRNRGRSDAVTEKQKLNRGIFQDMDDLEVVRNYFGSAQFQAIGFSYLGMMVALYSMQYPERVSRVVQLGPVQPDSNKQYPAHLTNTDGVLQEVLSEMRETGTEIVRLMASGRTEEARNVYRRNGPRIRRMFVADPANVHKLDHWDFWNLANEMGMMKHYGENIEPSIRLLRLTSDDLARVQAPVLTVHGTKDRNAPYGGGRDWALILPNARLQTIDNAAHATWADAPEQVFGSIRTFLGGAWPAASECVTAVDPAIQ
jgi:pimeloyl-ACP methyl ester carboxylesterase